MINIKHLKEKRILYKLKQIVDNSHIEYQKQTAIRYNFKNINHILQVCCEINYLGGVIYAIENGANVNNELYPLSVSIEFDNDNIVKYLLDNGALLDTKNDINILNYEPFGYAISCLRLDYIKLGLKYNPPTNAMATYMDDQFKFDINQNIILRIEKLKKII